MLTIFIRANNGGRGEVWLALAVDRCSRDRVFSVFWQIAHRSIQHISIEYQHSGVPCKHFCYIEYIVDNIPQAQRFGH